MTVIGSPRSFFVALGARMAQFREASDITQTQIAEALGLTQQSHASYVTGRRRIPVSTLPSTARLLSLSLEDAF
ncbi:helix-turn-helix transcriptional regulator [Caballeronia sp. ATUFL_F1_KS4A]|uniref:helix-turn-helix transcriptional regulator n=1 Tax=Caballeronia sp. ATUFL_F1_KS4A TaxID=2921768 RepID=UPI002028C879|nr:helix-turn-helix transcriptional regulator [Caballeronia sp. ATUFL_F1_KS4A]